MTEPNTALAHSGYLKPAAGLNWRSIIGFELGWLALVYFQSLAIVPAIAYLLYGLFRLPGRAQVAVVLITLAGIAIDSILTALNVISFSTSAILPVWFMMIWALFALAAVETMAALLRPWWLALILGASGGPLSYLGGAALSGGVLQFPLANWSFVVLIIVWSLLAVVLGRSRRFYAQTNS